jgi:molybdopterin converting factor subunit 1
VRVQVRLFAALAEAAGWRTNAVDFPEGARVWQARDQLLQAYPKLDPLCARAAFAVNAEYADLDRELRDGDELAVIPPVSGG